MNIIFDISNIYIEQYVKFLDTKPNNIMPGEFTKIIYSNDFVSLNGIYIDCPLDLHIEGPPKHQNMIKYTRSSSSSSSSTSSSSSLSDLSSTLSQTISLNSLSSYDTTRNYAYFQPNHSFNAAIIQQCKVFEERLLSYYMKYMFCSKRPVFLLHNILSNGSFKYYCDTGENVSDQIDVYGNEIKCKKVAKYVIKISGVWETVDTVGLTYKFLHLSTFTPLNI